MYINKRSQLVRNITLSIANGSITLIILLIAPLGLAAVIINTVLITISTFITATASDKVVRYLQPSQQPRNQTFQEVDEERETANISGREQNKLRR
jgi:hypothetical protein